MNIPFGRRAFLLAAGATTALTVPGMTAARATTGSQPDPDELFAVGLFELADLLYAAELRRDPNNAHAWAQRGYIALLYNRFADAQAFLGKAIDLAPSDTVSMSRLADCYVRQDNYGQAVALLTAAGDRIGAALYSTVAGAPYQITGASRTRVPWLSVDPLPSVNASVNGRMAAFTLDTGATFTFGAAMAKAAGVTPVTTVMVNHGHGPVLTYIGVVEMLQIGEIQIRNVPVMWDDVSFPAAPGDGPPVGVIGTPVFYHFQTTMDYADQALVLNQYWACPVPTPPTAPMWLAPDHFIFSWGRVGDHGPMPVLIDTGGVGLGVVLNYDQASAADVVPDYNSPESDFGVTVYPCTADVMLGPLISRDTPGVVGPIQPPANFGFGSAGTLSHELFKPLSVTFDFRAMTLTLM